MNISKLIESGNAVLMVSANDLKEFALQLIEEGKRLASSDAKDETYMTEAEVCKELGTTHTTLWRWKKSGYLKPVKVGKKNVWRQSEIIKIKEGKII